jgi:PAS domain S-box-containing protein
MDKNRKTATGGHSREYLDNLYKKYDETFDLLRFIRRYNPIYTPSEQISDEFVEKAFELLDKDTYEKQNINCGACGSDTCLGMARKLVLGVNIATNCIVKSKEDLMAEHKRNMTAYDQLTAMKQMREVDDRVRIMLDAAPFCFHIFDKDLRIIECNQAAVYLFEMSSKQEYMDRHHELSPRFQPDGRLSEEKYPWVIKKAFDEGYLRVEWMHQKLNGELIPIEATLICVNYKGNKVLTAYTRDLREQKRMMGEINATTAKLKAVVSNYPGAIWSVDKNRIITLFNGMRLREIGTSPDLLEGKELDLARQMNRYSEIAEKTHKTFTEGFQDWITEMDDKVYHARTAPIYDDDGEVAGVVGSLDDFTEIVHLQKDLEEALQQAGDAIKALETAQLTTSTMFESNPQINMLFDSNFRIIDCNPSAVKFMGVKTKEEMLNSFTALLVNSIPEFQPDGRRSVPFAERLMTAVKEGYINFETELYLNGEYRNVDATFRKIPYKNSFAIVAHVLDMTDAHKREMALAAAHEVNELQLTKLNLVVRASKIALWDMEVLECDPINPNNAFTMSDEFRHMLGFSNEIDFPNVLCSWTNRLHPDDSKRVRDALLRHLFDTTGNTPYDVEYRLQNKNGQYAYYRASGETIRDEQGNPIHIAGALVDITETKNILLDTEMHRIEAEAANNAKTAFLSAMSHEIRTPMNAILGITEIQLQKGAIDPYAKEAFEKIYSSGEMLLNIVNDILDLSKIEAGKMELVCGNYEIASTISDVVQLNIMRINSKPISFELSVDERTPTVLFGDELRIKQILNNILSNAFKYTETGTVTLLIAPESGSKEDTSDVTLVFIVSDTGQGMTREQMDRLFDEYSRFNLQANRLTEGTGLGMNITHNLLRLMNGEVTVESKLGVGSIFTVRLPQIKVGSDTLGREMAENLQQFKSGNWAPLKRVKLDYEPMPYGSVLIVDDVETNIYVASGLMIPYKLKIDSADSGYAAIEKVKNGNEYDIIFMDHMMPEMDGIETTKILRSMGYKRPIVALTANAVGGQADKFIGNGFDDFISKPINIKILNAVLRRMIRDKHKPEAIEENKKQMDVKEARLEDSAPLSPPVISPQLAEIFTRDATKSLAVLDAIIAKNGSYSDADIHNYTIHVHGMKSVLANIGNKDLSAVAERLERIGREKNVELITLETTAFVSNLRTFVEGIKDLVPGEKTEKYGTQAVDSTDLREKLLGVMTACKDFDERAADSILSELKQSAWPQPTRELLDTIASLLLHSDFDDIVSAVNEFLNTE